MKSWAIITIAVVILFAVIGGYIYINQPDSSDNNGIACAQDVKECPDRSFVGRNPANNCEFFECPTAITNNTVTGTQTPPQSQPKTVNIEIKDFSFSPKTIEINAGDSVVWVNKDSVRHTVTSDSGNELNSPYLSKEQSFSHTFTTQGEFDYHCTPHPYMKGKIIVK